MGVLIVFVCEHDINGEIMIYITLEQFEVKFLRSKVRTRQMMIKNREICIPCMYSAAP